LRVDSADLVGAGVAMSDALLREADKLARVADEVSAAYATELARILRDLEHSVRRLAMDASQGSVSAMTRAVRAAKLRKQIQTALDVAGFSHLAETASSAYLDTVLAQVMVIRQAAQVATFTSSDMTRVLALKELAKRDILHQGAAIAHAVWRTLAQGLFASRPVADLIDDLADALDDEQHAARTLYDTAVSVFGRQVEAMKSTPEDVCAYVGPADVKGRPFCRAHLGKVYTRDEIHAMDNGQLPDAMLTGGGYQCRHQFIAVSKLSEWRKLAGTDQRIPEIEAQLDALETGGRKAA
jgi:hypothetical protein